MEIVPLMRPFPITESAEPNRTNARRDNEEPMFENWKIDTAEPRREKLLTDKEEPSVVTLMTERVGIVRQAIIALTDNVAPRRANCRSDSDEPK